MVVHIQTINIFEIVEDSKFYEVEDYFSFQRLLCNSSACFAGVRRKGGGILWFGCVDGGDCGMWWETEQNGKILLRPISFRNFFGTYASMLPQKKPNFPERFRKESEYAETPC